MYVTCSTLCFAKRSLEEALQSIRTLRFTKADLAIHSDGPHLTPEEVVADPVRVSQRLRASNMGFAAFHLDLPPVCDRQTLMQLLAIARVARLLTVPVMTVPAATVGADEDEEVRRLLQWSEIVTAEGVILCVETARGTLTENPATAAMLCQRVPGLGITLDPSHYHATAQGPIDHDRLYEYTRHVRLRDSGAAPELFQVRVGQGELEYSRIIGQLERFQYGRALTVDIRDVADNAFPVEPEVRKMKYLLESLI
ncbi:MAG: TIM barrel protein [Bacteroidales bacterium]|nr:TIM barrel protein [Bacteroidales bacterium]